MTAKPKARTESPPKIVAMTAKKEILAPTNMSALGGPIRAYVDDGSVGSNSPRLESGWSNSLTML